MTEAATKSATQDIIVEEVLPHTPETIWKTLTTGALIGRWLGMNPTGFAPVKGTRFTLPTTPAGPWDGVIHCEVLDVVRNERFSHSWLAGDDSNNGKYGSRLDTIVTWTLANADGGTRLRLVHSGFVMAKNESAFRGLGEGWKKVVGRVGTVSGETN